MLASSGQSLGKLGCYGKNACRFWPTKSPREKSCFFSYSSSEITYSDIQTRISWLCVRDNGKTALSQ